MSIETLLEAAKFLELQAQQQQKAREENELREKLRLEQLSDHKRNDVTTYSSPIQMNHVTRGEESCPDSERCPAFVPPPLPPPSMTVIPIPMMTFNHTGLPPTVPTPSSTTLSPQAGAAPHLASPRRDPHSPGQGHQGQGVLLALSPQVKTDHSHHLPLAQSGNHKQNHHHHNHLPQIVSPHSGNHKLLQKQQQQSPQLVQPYPGSIVSAPQLHSLLPQPGPPQTPCGGQTSPIGGRGSPPDLDGKKRPGGRAHLKDCFDTLKKNIPNADEKKTSNLSVLRSALRYIQTLKRKEKEYEHEMERLVREKIATQQRLAELKNELSQWMNVMEIDRVLRQTFQPEDDQASTSTASEGEDLMDDDMDEENAPSAPTALPTMPQQAIQPELCKTVTPTPITPTTSNLTQHISSQHKAQMYPQLHPHLLSALPVSATFSTPTSSITTTPIQALLSAHTHIVTSPSTLFPAHTHIVTSPSTLFPAHTHIVTSPSTLFPAHTHMVKAPSLQPTVIAHSSASHASVIQAVNHVIQAQTSSGGAKHLTHLAPSASMQLAPGHHHHQPIGHITVHPVTHLGQHHLPTIYPQPVAVTQPAMVGHITHTITHAQVNGTAPNQGTTTIVGKQMGVGAQVVAHHPQLLNPVTMVTMPSFPVSTLKLA
ncbi:max-binding protein MNT-like isoform X2 [Salvelinus fontinalis]|uniref:max-binding protein MNT-like isoform X2 n=1 Tax=Salvelinus fontinalis TaxID=8038 RepID=UPI00248519D7|nr:max-binding protein MNT-like isoform X2 [Salvelinus fontinalis]